MLDNLQIRLPPSPLAHRIWIACGTLPKLQWRDIHDGKFLAREIDRAEIIPADRSVIDDTSGLRRKVNLVTMQSEVRFVDDISGEKRKVVLVYPEDASVDAGKIWILTPVGAALIGLSTGQSMSFKTPPADGVR